MLGLGISKYGRKVAGLQPFVTQLRTANPEAPVTFATSGTRITWQMRGRASGQFPSTTCATDNAQFVIVNTVSNFGGGFPNGELSGRYALGPVLLRASLLTAPGQTPIQLTFGKRTQITLLEGQSAVSDRLNVRLPASGWVSRIEMTTTIDNQIIGCGPGIDTGAGDAVVVGTNVLLDASLTDDGTQTYQNVPLAVLGAVVSPPSANYITNSLACVGDSIVDQGGYYTDALAACNLSFYWMAQAGHAATDYASRINLYASARGRVFLNAKQLVFEFGVNDFGQATGASRTFAQLQADFLTIAQHAAGCGVRRLTISTLTPLTTSTDAWATGINQTPTKEPQRTQWNTYVKSLVATGLYGMNVRVIDASLASSINGDETRWRNGFTTDGVHLSAPGIASVSSDITSLAVTAWTDPF